MQQPAVARDNAVVTGARAAARYLEQAGLAPADSQTALGCSFLLASLRLAHVTDDRAFWHAADQLARVAPSAAAAFAIFRSQLAGKQLPALAALLDVIAVEPDPYALSSFWQWLRRPAQRDVSSSSLKPGARKIAGQRLLLSTQHFTDAYMVDYLVGRCLDRVGEATVVDPACGSGNFLIGAMRRMVPGGDRQAIARVLERRLLGYDADPLMEQLTTINLVVESSRHAGALVTTAPRLASQSSTHGHGFFSRTATGWLTEHRGTQPLAILTNPPFLGRRLMSAPLRAHLRRHWPEARGDLCASFLLHTLSLLRPGDVLGAVHQSNWLHLSSFASYRMRIAEGWEVADRMELGPGAFAHLSGEKANVTLSVFQAHTPRSRTRPRTVRTSRSASLVQYGELAQPMQGTSTGDNATLVRFAWQVDPADTAWRRASKGGGHARWAGLNRYRVLWGTDGEVLRDRRGAVLRNVEAAAHAELVYTDTGAAGFSARFREPGTVVLASGPAIRVLEGHPLAHLALLNTSFVRGLLRDLSPKLSLSVGYLRRLPAPAELLGEANVIAWASRCMEIKRRQLSYTPGNDEFVFSPLLDRDLEAHLVESASESLTEELERLDLECRIEKHVAARYQQVGLRPDSGPIPGRPEGRIQAIARHTGKSAQAVHDALLSEASHGGPVLGEVLENLLHGAALDTMGMIGTRRPSPRRMTVFALCEGVRERVPGDERVMKELLGQDLQTWLLEGLPDLHSRLHLGHPVFTVDHGDVLVTRP